MKVQFSLVPMVAAMSHARTLTILGYSWHVQRRARCMEAVVDAGSGAISIQGAGVLALPGKVLQTDPIGYEATCVDSAVQPGKKELFDELLAGVQEMDEMVEKAVTRVTEYPGPEVEVIRVMTGLSQVRFASMIGVSKWTLETWGQGRRHPTGPAKALLRILEADLKHAL